MTMLPPTQPIPSGPTSTASNGSHSTSSNGGKEFADTLNKVTSRDQKDRGDAKPSKDSSNVKRADTADKPEETKETKAADDTATAETDKPVDGDAAKPEVVATAIVEVAVVTANLTAGNAEATAAAANATATAVVGEVTPAATVQPVAATPAVDAAPKTPATAETPDVPTTPTAAPEDGAPVTTVATATISAQTQGETPDQAVATALAGDAAKALAEATKTDGQPAPVDSAEKKVATAAELGIRPSIENLAQTAKTADIPKAPPITHQALPEPVRQVVHLVQPLRQLGDGDYRLTLQLYPEHLGRVEVAVALNSGQISMQLTADNGQSRQMLKDSMPDLRQALQESGLDAGSLDVSDHDFFGQQQNGKETTQSGQIRGTETDMDEETFLGQVAARVSTQPNATDGAVDVRV